MYGIDALKKVALVLATFGEKLEDALADGKIKLAEAISLLFSTAPDVFALVQDAQQIKAEFADLTAAEKEELAEYLADELDLDNDKVEGIVEAGVDVLVALEDLRVAIKA